MTLLEPLTTIDFATLRLPYVPVAGSGDFDSKNVTIATCPYVIYTYRPYLPHSFPPNPTDQSESEDLHVSGIKETCHHGNLPHIHNI